MSKNNNINMERLDHYYDQRFSFKCSDIFKWCRRNISNPNFDVSYAASELYNHYFTSERRPNLQSYYYIRYNTNSKYLYRIERDIVLSPLSLPSVDMVKLHVLLRKIDRLECKIRNHKNATQEDLDKLSTITSIFNRRCRSIIHSRFHIEKFSKLSHKDKAIINCICEDRYKELQLICIVLDGIDNGDSN